MRYSCSGRRSLSASPIPQGLTSIAGSPREEPTLTVDNSDALSVHLFDEVVRIHELTKLHDFIGPESQELSKYDSDRAPRGFLLHPRHDRNGRFLFLHNQKDRLVGENFKMGVNSFKAFNNGRFSLLLSKAREKLDWGIADKIDIFVDEVLNKG